MAEQQTRGIILAGGAGTRLYPLTSLFSKQLQAVYDKPMIYYPIATMMLVGIRDILIISTPRDTPHFETLLGDGSQWGISLSYRVQDQPRGIAEAFLVGRDFIKGYQVCLLLGDNLFYGYLDFLRNSLARNEGATVFAYQVDDPRRYGVVEFDSEGNAISIEEKPESPRSNYAVPGIYIYDTTVAEKAEGLDPSGRGELEITDLNRVYLEETQLRVEIIGRGIAWLDMGDPGSLLEAGEFIRVIEARQGLKIACLEEIAYLQEYVDDAQFAQLIEETPPGPYQSYLLRLQQCGRNGSVGLRRMADPKESTGDIYV